MPIKDQNLRKLAETTGSSDIYVQDNGQNFREIEIYI